MKYYESDCAACGGQAVLTTPRLLLRRLTAADAPALLAFMAKPEVMYAWEHGFTREDVDSWIARQAARYDADGYGYWALVERSSGALVGQAGLMKSCIHGQGCVEVGYLLAPHRWGRGYAAEAARACLAYAFGPLGLDEVWASIRPTNEASLRVARALGMTPCGSHTVVYRGKPMPHLLLCAVRPARPSEAGGTAAEGCGREPRVAAEEAAEV